jgi:hypothetical protein
LTVEPPQSKKPNKLFVTVVIEQNIKECRERLERAIPQRLRRLRRASSRVA